MRGNRKTKSERKLGIEHLEKREVFAGNVTAFINSGGALQLNGDGFGNSVDVREIGTNVYRVEGFGTTINGASYRDFYVATDKVQVHLAGGDDYLRIRDSVMAGLDVHMGQGNDIAAVHDVTVYGAGNSARFQMGSSTEVGKDSLHLTNDRFMGNLHAQMGAGDDYIAVFNTRVDNYLSIWGEAGTDTYSWNNSSYGKLWAWNSIEKKR